MGSELVQDPEFRDVVDPSHSAIIVIDIQNDACHPDGEYGRVGWDISQRRESAHRAKAFIEQAREFDVPIIFTQGTHSEWHEPPSWRRRRTVLGHNAYREGTWGAEFYEVEPQPQDAIVVKHRYSAFIRTDLETVLRSKGITTLLLTGGGTNACVEATALDGFMLDYDVVVVADCCGTPHPAEHEPALARMSRRCGTVVESSDLIEAWSARAQGQPAASLTTAASQG
jgi:ureidoacrylate peracid hydrolase